MKRPVFYCKNFICSLILILTVHVYRNLEARSCNHCCSGKAIIITYSECVFVALDIQHAKSMYHIVV